MVKLAQKPAPNGEYFICSEWFDAWKNSKEEDVNANIKLTCPHDKLAITKNKRLITSELWDYIKELYPESRAYIKNEDECEECKAVQDIKDAEAQELQEKLTVIKNELYAALTVNRSPFKFKPGKYYLINRRWVTEWKQAVDRGEIPNAPLNNSLLSDSGFVHYDPENERNFYGVPENTWNALRERYGSENLIPIILTIHDNNKYTLDPPFSSELAEKRRQTEYKDTIWISTKNATPAQRKNNNFKNFKLQLPPDTTIETLKLQIFQQTSLDPLYQQLIYNNVKLTDNHKSLSDYSVNGGTIHLYILDENSAEIDYSSVVYDNIQEVELGFKGSYLHGSDNEEEREEQQQQQQTTTSTEPITNYEDWECTQCTYINSSDFKECDMCGSNRIINVLL